MATSTRRSHSRDKTSARASNTTVEKMTGWLAGVAKYNPVTYILNAARSAEITGTVIWSNTWPGLVAALVLIIVLGAFALAPLRHLENR